MGSQGVNWWGYAEGNALMLGVIGASVLLFAAAYLYLRLREHSAGRKRRS